MEVCADLVLGVPQSAIEEDARRVTRYAIRGEERILPARFEVPTKAHTRDGQVSPAIGDPERAEIHVAGGPAVGGDDRIGRSGIAVADHETVDRRHAEPLDLDPIFYPGRHRPVERTIGHRQGIV